MFTNPECSGNMQMIDGWQRQGLPLHFTQQRNELMHRTVFTSLKRSLLERRLPVILFLTSLLVSLPAGVLLFGGSLLGGLIALLVAVGLDPLRAQLIAALVMTAGAALVGAGSSSGPAILLALFSLNSSPYVILAGTWKSSMEAR